MSELGIWAPLLALVGQTVILSVTGTWYLGRALNRLDTGFRDAIQNSRREMDHDLGEVENELRNQVTGIETNLRQAIESAMSVWSRDLAAVRDRLHAHELTTSRDFVRRESFYKVADEIKSVLNDRLKTLEVKVDSIRSAE